MVSKKTKTIRLLLIVSFVCLAGLLIAYFNAPRGANRDAVSPSSANKTDTTAPVVALDSSVDLSVAQSTSFKVEVSASDNKTVTKVEYRIDGQFVAVSYSSPFGEILDISNLSVGEHTLTVTAYDASGNVSIPKQYKFTVAVSSAQQAPQTSSTDQPSGYYRKTAPANAVRSNTSALPSVPSDATPPTKPTNFSLEQSAEHDVKLTWDASVDNVGVAGYKIWRDGQYIGTATSTNFTDTNAIPGKTYGYTVAAYDAAGNLSSASQTISITLADITIFTSADNPPSSAAVDNNGIEVGLRIRPSVDGYITGVRFYKNNGNTGTHIGNIWDMSGVNLGTVTFTNETATGWQTARFSSPVAVRAGVDYVVSYYAPDGNYTATGGFFTSSFFSSEYLVVPASAETGTTGVYKYNGSSTFPTDNFNNANYWVDAAFSPSAVVSTPTSFAACPAYPAFPDASCTGVEQGSTLIPYHGVLTVTHDNTTLYNMDITGTINVRANNFTLVNSKVHDATPGVGIYDGNATIRNSEFYNIDETAIGYTNWKGYNLNIHDMLGDGVKLGNNVELEDSYIHDFTPGAGSHSDGGQMQNGTSNVIVRHNTIDAVGANSALFMAPDLGPDGTGPIVIDKNLLGGGGYTLYIVDGNNGQYHQTGYTVTNNRFMRNANYWSVRVNEPLTNFDAWTNNVWDDTSEVITNPAS